MLIDSQPVILLISVVQPTKFLRGLLLLINNDMKEKSYIREPSLLIFQAYVQASIMRESHQLGRFAARIP